MQESNANWQVSAKLRRVNWLMRAELVETKLHAFKRAVKANFNPNQPRVPAGNPDGGQWTSPGGGVADPASSLSQIPTDASVTVERILAVARRVITAGGPLDYQRCLDLCYPLLERPQHPASYRNEWDFHKCMNACLQQNL